MEEEPLLEEATGIEVESEVEGFESATEEAEGMPQLDFATFDNQIFWLVLSLVAIYLIVTRVAMPRIGTVLADRTGTIAGDLQAAETLRASAREAEAAYDRALAQARAEAGRIAAATRAEIQRGLDADLAAANARIEAQAAAGAARVAEIDRDAQASVREVAREVARELVAALGGTPDPATLDAAVARRAGGAA